MTCEPRSRRSFRREIHAWCAASSFEREFAAYSDAAYGIGISSGTAALHLGLRALGVGPGDEVITVPNTYVATVFAITYVGATPVFVDVDPITANMDARRVSAAITDRTKAIVPVHMYGQCVDIDAIRSAAPGIAIWRMRPTHGATYTGARPAASASSRSSASTHRRCSVRLAMAGC